MTFYRLKTRFEQKKIKIFGMKPILSIYSISGWSVFELFTGRGLFRRIMASIDKIQNLFEFGESLDLSMNLKKNIGHTKK
jgi:hypothetical protein